MTTLLKPARFCSISLRNRLVRSATWEGACDEAGRPTEKTIEYYRALSKGGVGLIISGYTYVSADGKQQKGQAGLCDDAFQTEYRALVDTVHGEGGAVMRIPVVHRLLPVRWRHRCIR
jgi:2,4-dienoyl-CoA reductase-like NADH-dependent reductase (Old Yellow Enzyme family)